MEFSEEEKKVCLRILRQTPGELIISFVDQESILGLKWTIEIGLVLSPLIVTVAVRMNKFRSAEFLLDKCSPSFRPYPLTNIAEEGNIQGMAWLMESGCTIDQDTIAAAAYGDQLETVKWLIARGCPMDEEAIVHAAVVDNYAMVSWLKDNGCPWNKKRVLAKTSHASKPMKKWLKSL